MGAWVREKGGERESVCMHVYMQTKKVEQESRLREMTVQVSVCARAYAGAYAGVCMHACRYVGQTHVCMY